VQSWLPRSFVFKSFNQAGWEAMGEAATMPTRPVMFVAGENSDAKPSVLGLVADLGFDAVDAGPLKMSRLLEPYALLWISLAMKQGLPRNFGFGVIRPPLEAGSP
jgi:predicted dinucleotide-binding enzyme